jgi:hypothetical protein
MFSLLFGVRNGARNEIAGTLATVRNSTGIPDRIVLHRQGSLFSGRWSMTVARRRYFFGHGTNLATIRWSGVLGSVTYCPD